MNTISDVRNLFPILNQKVNGKPLIYFDNAATSQKPKQVIEAIENYYSQYNSNIHRGAHYLANLATEAYEHSRQVIAQYLNAETQEINFVRGTTEGINLVAQTYGKANVKAGDEIIVSAMEHHSNIVPWQMLCEEKGATLKVVPIFDSGDLDMEAYEKLLSAKTKIVAVTYISNALGTVNPVQEIIAKAHEVGAVVLVDAAQAVQHKKIDVKALDVDFLAFSGHKVFGPTGIGILYGKRELLEAMPPYMGGGEMIDNVTFEKTTFNKIPYKFEAGTPHIEGGIVLGKAIEFVQEIGLDFIAEKEAELLHYGTQKLSAIDGLRFVGTAQEKCSVISFLVKDIHPYDIGTLLDKQGIAIRTGHHCCQPLMKRLQIEGTCRASFAFYNTTEEIDVFAEALEKSIAMLS
ncbi:MAG TPA: cysteine desulfurase [Chitinophagales bacterium]|nr:cysteine desulfurase [Chitinophagales bacterium]HRP39081.1 cysteine desulfurase [Chitinophagales bacterium]